MAIIGSALVAVLEKDISDGNELRDWTDNDRDILLKCALMYYYMVCVGLNDCTDLENATKSEYKQVLEQVLNDYKNDKITLISVKNLNKLAEKMNAKFSEELGDTLFSARDGKIVIIPKSELQKNPSN